MAHVMRAWQLVPVLFAACTSVARPPEFVERVEQVERARLERHLAALEAIGPRPIEDREATTRTVAWLQGELEALGLEVVLEPVSYLAGGGRAFARVRRADAGPEGPEGEVRVLEQPPGFLGYGARVIAARTRALRAEGWEVLGYAVEGAGSLETRTASNVLAEIPGHELPDRVIELSAHYDTVPGCPGASDNSSGVAAVLEAARVLADARPRRPFACASSRARRPTCAGPVRTSRAWRTIHAPSRRSSTSTRSAGPRAKRARSARPRASRSSPGCPRRATS